MATFLPAFLWNSSIKIAIKLLPAPVGNFKPILFYLEIRLSKSLKIPFAHPVIS
jgi:hypothetical protein